MRRVIFAAVSLLLLAFPLCFAAPQQQSVAEAARKAREQKKNQPKAARTLTTDDLAGKPRSVPAAAPAEKETAAPTEATDEKAGAPEEKVRPPEEQPGAEAEKEAKPKDEKGEAYWRKRFAEARAKLQAAEKEADLLQRELNLQQQQFYSDPNKALREQYERKDINENSQKVAEKKKEIERLKQALSDLEDELRRASGDPGWARE